MKLLFPLLAILIISIQTPALSSPYDPGNEEDKFWSSYAKSDFKSASEISEKLSESKLDYLFLSAICDFNSYRYSSYIAKSDRYQSLMNSNYSSLKILLEKHYRKDRHELNNLMGIVKYFIPSIELESANVFLERSIALEHYNPRAYNFLALTYMQKGIIDKAIELARLAISMDPGYPEPYNVLAFALQSKGDHIEAMDKLLESMINCPVNTNDTYSNFIRISCNTVTLFVGDTTVSVPGFKSDELRDRTLEKLKGHNKPLFELAFHFFLFQSYPEADSVMNVISVDTTIQDKYYYLSSLNGLKMGDTVRFEACIDKMVRLNESKALLDLGSYFYKTEDLDKSVEVLKLLESMPVNNQTAMKTQSNLGTIEMKLGNYKKAVKHFKKALKMDSGDVITLTNMGVVYSQLEKQSKAVRYLHKAKEYCTTSSQTKSIDYWLTEIEKTRGIDNE